MAQLVSREGEVVDVAPGDVNAFLQSGRFGLPAGQAVDLVDENGQVVVFDDPEDAATLLADPRGPWRLATPEESQQDRDRAEFSDLGSQLGAATEGALGAATLGASDLAIQSGIFGEGFAEESRKRAEFSPTARGAGELAGILGSSLLTGGAAGAAGAAGRGLARGAGAVARGVTAPARGALGLGMKARGATEAAATGLGASETVSKLAGLAATGALEGGIFGAASEVSRTALDRSAFQDPELAAERIVAGAGWGALFGAGAGVALGAVGEAVTRGRKAVSLRSITPEKVEKFLDERLDEFIEERAFKAALGGRNIKRVREARRLPGGVRALGRDALEERVVTPTSTIEDIAQTADDRAEVWGRKVGELAEALDDTGKQVNSAEAAKAIRAQVIAPLRKRAATERPARAVADALEPMLAKFEQRGTMPVREFWLERRAFDKTIRFDIEARTPGMRAIRQARSVMERQFEEQTERLAKEVDVERFSADFVRELLGGKPAPPMPALAKTFQEVFRAAKAKYSHMTFLHTIAEEAIERDISNRLISPSDYGIGSLFAAGELVTGDKEFDAGTLAAAFAGGMLHRTMRERGSAFVAGTLDAVRKAASPSKAAQHALNGTQRVTEAVDGVIARLKGLPVKASKAPKLAKELTASDALRSLKKGTRVLGVRVAATRGAKMSEAYEQILDKVAEMQDPNSEPRQQARRGAVAMTVQDEPQLAGALDAHIDRAAAYISSRVPAGRRQPVRSTGTENVFAHLRKAAVSESELRDLVKTVERATEPGHLLARVRSGDWSIDDIEALKELYPRTYEELRLSVIERLSEVEKIPAFEDRIRLGIAFDIPVDASLTPQSFLAIQGGASQGLGDIGEEPEAEGAQQGARPPQAPERKIGLSDQLDTNLNRYLRGGGNQP